jgi:hypothetical protein
MYNVFHLIFSIGYKIKIPFLNNIILFITIEIIINYLIVYSYNNLKISIYNAKFVIIIFNIQSSISKRTSFFILEITSKLKFFVFINFTKIINLYLIKFSFFDDKYNLLLLLDTGF